MSSLIEGKGSCLCGETRVVVKSMSKSVGVCHCSMCRKWGGPVMAVDCGSEVSFEGEENISVFNSSEWAERGFCNNELCKCDCHKGTVFRRGNKKRQYC